MNAIGILQGRLSPAPSGRAQAFPGRAWRDEFAAAPAIGFDAVEWIVTGDRTDDNPIWTDAGSDEARRVANAAGLRVSSVCLDCFIEQPLVRVTPADRDARLQRLATLVRQSARLGAPVVLLPLLEANAVNDAEAADLLAALAPVLQLAQAHDVIVAIESDWSGERLRDWIAAAAAPSLGAYYDIGNAVTFGLDPRDDLRALGRLLHGVHVKDRRHGGGSVALGDGDADLAGAAATLVEIGYAGPMVLETPQGADPLASAAANLAAVRRAFPATAAVRS